MPSALRPVRILQGLLLGLLLVLPSAARAQDVVGKVTQLNKKALEAYDNLEFDQAKQLLNQAIEQCQVSGLDKHPIRARSYVHLGVVLIAGFKQKDEGTKMFCEALKTTPEIKLTKSLANPELQEAFDEANKACGKGGVGSLPGSSSLLTVSHDPVTQAGCRLGVPITATVSGDGKYDKVTLFYRHKSVPDYSDVEMARGGAGDLFKAEIPATEMVGGAVVYYIAAQTADGLTVASKGNPLDPIIVTPSCVAVGGTGGKSGGTGGRGGSTAEKVATGPRFVIGLGAGTGIGWVSGAKPEVNSPRDGGTATVSGINMAALLHVAPELGYMLTPSMMLSVQGRVQIITGNVKVADAENGTSGCPVGSVSDKSNPVPLCDTAKLAPSVLAKLTLYFAKPTSRLRPFAGLAVGGGYVRNSVKLTVKDDAGQYRYGDCYAGGSPLSPCKDTVRMGPVLGGPLAGLLFNATPAFGLALTVQALAGFPDFGVNLDVTGSALLRL